MKTNKRRVRKCLASVREFSHRFDLAKRKYLSIFLGIFCINSQGYKHFGQVINFREFHLKNWKQKILHEFSLQNKWCISRVCNQYVTRDWLGCFRYNCTQGPLNNEGGRELNEKTKSRQNKNRQRNNMIKNKQIFFEVTRSWDCFTTATCIMLLKCVSVTI